MTPVRLGDLQVRITEQRIGQLERIRQHFLGKGVAALMPRIWMFRAWNRL